MVMMPLKRTKRYDFENEAPSHLRPRVKKNFPNSDFRGKGKLFENEAVADVSKQRRMIRQLIELSTIDIRYCRSVRLSDGSSISRFV